MEAFIKKFGVLRGIVNETTGRFNEDAADFTDAQDTLRWAWTGGKNSLADIEAQVRHALDAQASVKAGGIALTIDNLWNLVCVLFLLDYAEGNTAVCANPECPAPSPGTCRLECWRIIPM